MLDKIGDIIARWMVRRWTRREERLSLKRKGIGKISTKIFAKENSIDLGPKKKDILP